MGLQVCYTSYSFYIKGQPDLAPKSSDTGTLSCSSVCHEAQGTFCHLYEIHQVFEQTQMETHLGQHQTLIATAPPNSEETKSSKVQRGVKVGGGWVTDRTYSQ